MKVTSDVGPWSIVPEWVLDAEVSDRAVRLYLLLGRYADNHTGESTPARRTLAERLRCSLDTLDRAVKELVAIGALEYEDRERQNGSQTTNLWRLRLAHPGRMGAAPPPLTGAAPRTKATKELETPSAAAPRQPRKKADLDAIWDCLTDIFGPVTVKSKEQLRGKWVKELADAGATPDEMIRRAKSWPNHFDGATLTESALVKWWDTLGRKPLRRR